MPRKNWQRDELIIALNLYWKTPYNKISGSSNAKIKEIANIIGRSPAALAFKLMNFTSLDEERQLIGNKGKSGYGKLDAEIWNEFKNRWEELAYQSYLLLETYKSSENDDTPILKKGYDKLRMVKTRVNQSDFRQRILASYNNKCCITGIDIPTLLVASHIIPWSENKEERLNPRNGLCLNAIHDKAFDKGLLTVTPQLEIKISNEILNKPDSSAFDSFFKSFESKKIILPDRYKPSIEFLKWHFTPTHFFAKVEGNSYKISRVMFCFAKKAIEDASTKYSSVR